MLDRIASDRPVLTADRIIALVRAILEKRSIARSVGRDDDLGECGISSLDMVNLMLAVEEVLDSIIDGGEELIQLDAAHGARAFSDHAALYPAWAK